MKSELNDLDQMERWAKSLGGVFELVDFQNLWIELSTITLQRRLARWVESGWLERFSRGIYLWKNYDSCRLAMKLSPHAVITSTTILAEQMLIGTRSDYQITCVHPGPKKIFQGQNLQVLLMGVKPNLIFGFENRGGIRKADLEKACLDTLYAYQHGHRFVFDPLSDVDYRRLDLERVGLYLERYQNPKFVKFAEGVIYGAV